MTEISDILDYLPILDEKPCITSGRKDYALCIAMVEMVYPLTRTKEPQVGFIFGVNPDRTILYFSRYASRDNKGPYACNPEEISLDTRFIKEIDVLREF